MTTLTGTISFKDGGTLLFEALPTRINKDDCKIVTRMDQLDSFIELRHKDGELLDRWSRREIEDAVQSGELVVKNAAALHESAYKSWEKRHPQPAADVPVSVFHLHMNDCDALQFMGRLKLLTDWLGDHADKGINVKKAEPKPQQPSAPAAPAREPPGKPSAPSGREAPEQRPVSPRPAAPSDQRRGDGRDVQPPRSGAPSKSNDRSS